MKSDWNDFKAFNEKIAQLRRLRIKADYKNEEIISYESKKAIDLSNDIIHILNKL
jgi:hypothetical protein